MPARERSQAPFRKQAYDNGQPNGRDGDTPRLHIARLSDIGRARDHQEDMVGVCAPADPATLIRKGYLLIVADGMGGHNTGEVASATAVAEIQRVYYEAPTDEIPANLRNALASAHQLLCSMAQADPNKQGMGTTAAVVVVRGREVHIANVGDSRVYLLRNGAIAQITQDHSWVAEQVREGVFTEEQARVHPQRNVVTRALGGGSSAQPDLYNGQLHDGDVLLLCSDGLSNPVRDGEMLEVAGRMPPDQAVKRLVDLANERGGGDNISLVIARLEPAEALPAAALRKRPRVFAILGLAVLLLLVAAAAAFAITQGILFSPRAAPPAGPAATVTIPPSPSASAAGGLSGALAEPSPRPTQPQPASAPTATLAPTFTPSPIPTPTWTPRAVSTSTRSPPVSHLAPVTLVEPQDGLTVFGTDSVRFSWSPAQLKGNQAYELRIWKTGDSNHAAAGSGTSIATWQTVRLDQANAVKEGGEGEYNWTVAVVESNPNRQLAAEATPRKLIYRRARAAASPTLPPRHRVEAATATPISMWEPLPSDTPHPADTVLPPTQGVALPTVPPPATVKATP
jgi:PPM family protein phosphatase